MRAFWKHLSAPRKEALTLNLAGTSLAMASLSGGSSVPLVLPLIGLALTGYAIHMYRKIEKGDR